MKHTAEFTMEQKSNSADILVVDWGTQEGSHVPVGVRFILLLL